MNGDKSITGKDRSEEGPMKLLDDSLDARNPLLRQHEKTKREYDLLRQQYDKISADYQQLNMALTQTKRQLAKDKEQLALYLKQREEIKASLSWKITKPLRAIGTVWLTIRETVLPASPPVQQSPPVRSSPPPAAQSAPLVLCGQWVLNARKQARAQWRQLRRGSQKKSMLVFSSLGAPATHVDMYSCTRPFYHDSDFDTIALAYNFNKVSEPGLICETIPEHISDATRLVRDARFYEQAAWMIPLTPASECLTEGIESWCTEYRVGNEYPQALASLAYMFLLDAFSYYRPDIVCGYDKSPICSIARAAAQKLGIPYCAIEWGVLGGTYTFDMCGSMGESWVARYPSDFNALPLMKEDIERAEHYIQDYQEHGVSRNTPKKLPSASRDAITRLKAAGKKIVLVCGGNDPYSGNVPYSNRAKTFHAPFYPTNEDLLLALSQRAFQYPELAIVYKPHPITVVRGVNIPPDVQRHITLVKDGGIADYLRLCDVAVINFSQTAYESLLYDKPVVMTGLNQLSYSGAVYTIDSREALMETIALAAHQGYTAEQRECFTQHVARVLKYYLFGYKAPDAAKSISAMAGAVLSIMENRHEPYYKYERAAYVAQMKEDTRECANISVVLPAYNAGGHIVECLNSILNQTVRCKEIICLNQGSTDDTQEILEYYAANHAEVKIIQLTGEPWPSRARNAGMRAATGRYIYFMDSKGVAPLGLFEEMMKLYASADPDFVYFPYREVSPQFEAHTSRFHKIKELLPDGETIALLPNRYLLFCAVPFAYTKFFKTSFLRERNLMFDERLAIHDDTLHNIECLLSAAAIIVHTGAVYNHRIERNKGSAISYDHAMLHTLMALAAMNEALMKVGLYDEYQKIFTPLKADIASSAWTELSASEQTETYYNSLKSIFSSSDVNWLTSDLAVSCGINNEQRIQLIKSVLGETR